MALFRTRVAGRGAAAGRLIFRTRQTDTGGQISTPIDGIDDTLDIDADALAGVDNLEIDVYGQLLGTSSTGDIEIGGTRYRVVSTHLSLTRYSSKAGYEYSRVVVPDAGFGNYFQIQDRPYQSGDPGSDADREGRWTIGYLIGANRRGIEVLMHPETFEVTLARYGGNSTTYPRITHFAVFST